MIPDKISCPNCEKEIEIIQTKFNDRFECDCGIVGGRGRLGIGWGWVIDLTGEKQNIELGPENRNLEEALDEAKRRLKLLAFD